MQNIEAHAQTHKKPPKKSHSIPVAKIYRQYQSHNRNIDCVLFPGKITHHQEKPDERKLPLQNEFLAFCEVGLIN